MSSTFEYKTVLKKDFNTVENDIKNFLSKINLQNDRLKGNYSIEKFYKDNPVALSIIYKNNRIYEISNVLEREAFLGGVRVLNRLLVDPSLRDTVPAASIPETTLTMLSQQIEICKDKYDFAFISRETKTHLFVKKFAKCAKEFSNLPWRYEEEKYQICNWNKTWRDYPHPECWHYIAWVPFKEIDTFPLDTRSTF